MFTSHSLPYLGQEREKLSSLRTPCWSEVRPKDSVGQKGGILMRRVGKPDEEDLSVNVNHSSSTSDPK